MTGKGSKSEEHLNISDVSQNFDSNVPDDSREDENADKEKFKEKNQKDQHKLKKDKNQEKIAELEATIADLTDRHLRLHAEFDNYRKRTLKEKAELIKSGGESVLLNILPIIDDFDRALITMKDVADDDPAKIGFLLIFNKFKDFLRQNNIKEIEVLGTEFSVDQHFALSKVPSPSEDMKGKIIDVVEKGYLLNDKVIRFAKVIIGY